MEPNGQLHLLLHIMEIPNMQVNIVVFKIKIILSIQFISHRHYQLSTSRSPNITRRRTTLNWHICTDDCRGGHLQTSEGVSSGDAARAIYRILQKLHTVYAKLDFSVHLHDDRKTKCVLF